jgi:type II secretory pathway pseudopilin PulG
VGLILDLAVVALALVVIGSLALLAWTLGVSAVRSVRRGRASVAEVRRSAAESEVRLVAEAERARSILERLTRRTTPKTAQPMTRPTQTPTPGEQPDA